MLNNVNDSVKEFLITFHCLMIIIVHMLYIVVFDVDNTQLLTFYLYHK
jgi:hypothetical protein